VPGLGDVLAARVAGSVVGRIALFGEDYAAIAAGAGRAGGVSLTVGVLTIDEGVAVVVLAVGAILRTLLAGRESFTRGVLAVCEAVLVLVAGRGAVLDVVLAGNQGKRQHGAAIEAEGTSAH
jgi:hypothetical protein